MFLDHEGGEDFEPSPVGSREGEGTDLSAAHLAAEGLLEGLQTEELTPESKRHKVSALLRLVLPGAVPVSVFSELKQEMIERFTQADELFGVAKQQSKRVCRLLDRSNGTEFAIVTHRNPDLDGVSSALHLQALLAARGVKASIHSGDGNVEALEAQLPESAKSLQLRPVSEVSPSQAVVLVDANEPYKKNVGLDPNLSPLVIFDTHHPEQNTPPSETTSIILEDHTASVTVVIGCLMPLVPKERRQDFLESQQWSSLATWAVLGLVSDTANARRAASFDVDAIYQLLPFVDPDLLGEYENAPFQQQVKEFIRLGRQGIQTDEQGAATHLHRVLPQERHSAATSSDFLLRGTQARALMVTYQIGDQLYASIRMRITDDMPDSEEVDRLAKAVIGEEAGSRGGGVAGGVLSARTYGSVENTVRAVHNLFFQKVRAMSAA